MFMCIYAYICYKKFDFAVPAVPERSFMPDKPVKLNWNLFKIVRPECPAPPELVPDASTRSDATIGQQELSLPEKNARDKVLWRPIHPDEPLAYCAGCKDWTPMRWLPVAERKKKPEQWFQCEFCGGRNLTLRYAILH